MTMASADPEPQDVRLAEPGDGDHPYPHGTEGVHSNITILSDRETSSKDGNTKIQTPVKLLSTYTSGDHNEEKFGVSTSEDKGNLSDSTSRLTHREDSVMSPHSNVIFSPQVVATSAQDGVVMPPTTHIVSDVPRASSSSEVVSPVGTRVSHIPNTCRPVPKVSAVPQVPPSSEVASTVGTRVSHIPNTCRPVSTNLSTTKVSPTRLPGFGETSDVRSSPSSTGVPEDMPMLDHLKPQPLYEELNEIGNGAYGTVYRARDLVHAGRVVALKKIRINLTEEGVPVFAIREIATLKQLERFNHPNIVRLLDICQGRIENDRLTLMLVFEYMDQDLDKYLKRCPSPGLEPSRIKSLIHQVIEGVDFLHSNRVIHRDLKPQNILVDHCGRIKIADFGLARIYDFNMRLTTTVVTLWYRAPEVLLSNSYATPVDVWSCGCIFAELFRRRPIFEGRTEGDQLQVIFDVIGTPLESEWPRDVSLLRSNFRYHAPQPLQDVVPEITPDAVDLMQKMLKFKPDCRISALEAKNHPYFDSLRASSSGFTAGSSRSSSSSSSQSLAPLPSVPLSPIRSPVPSTPVVPLGLLSNASRALTSSSPGRALGFCPNKVGAHLTPGKNIPVLPPRPATPSTPVVTHSGPGGNDENNPNAGNSAPTASSTGGPSGPSKPVVTAVLTTTTTGLVAATPTATVSGSSGSTGATGGTANR